MSTPTDKLAEEFMEKLKESGVNHFVIAYSDPDDNTDYVGVFGSKYWRCGIGQELMDDVRQERKQEREEP